MKLTIKTLDQKTFHVDFDDSKTVWDLKAHLYKLPEIGVQPEQQQLIYAGRVLVNEDVLKKYSIDERKFLVVMAKKPVASGDASAAPKPEKKEPKTSKPPSASGSDAASSTRKVDQTPSTQVSAHNIRPGPSQTAAAAATGASSEVLTPNRRTAHDSAETAAAAANLPTNLGLCTRGESRTLLELLNARPSISCNETLVREIMNMGYAEADVRRALIASFNNADRAIEYLIEGIPEFPEMFAPQPAESRTDRYNPLSFLRDDPRFHAMRRVIQQRPELLSMVLSKLGESNPALIAIIREHQDEFLRMLNESEVEGETSEPEDYAEDVVEVVLTEEDRLAVDRLVGLGFPREMVVQAYIACEKNEEQTADFLCRHMEDN